jgi:hypothetical protein
MKILRSLAALALLATFAVSAPASRAASQPAPGEALLTVCTDTPVEDIPELGPRTCKSFDSGAVLVAAVCGELPLPPEACANLTDGRVIDSALVDAYQQSWVHRALRLQQQLDVHEPLRNSLMPHTHNSFNASAYATTVSNLDPNQRYGLTDQLRMDIRGIELDLHWAPHPSGTPATGGKAVVLCHGEAAEVGTMTIHLGCSADRLFTEGLTEIRAFLDAPGNEHELVLLYLENALDGDVQAHDAAAAAIEHELGGLVARPPAGAPCAPMPLDTSRAELIAAGHRVLIVGNCGPGAWGSWVHLRGPDWDEGGDGDGYAPPPACEATRAARSYDTHWIRIYEDSTWLTAMVNGSGHRFGAAETRAMVRCGVDMIGFDRIEPGDGRLEALVWSWAPNEPVVDATARCAAWGTDARFRAEPCGETRGYACRTAAGAWVVPAERGAWENGFAACERVGAHYAVPPTGWEDERLRAVATGGELWLDYQSIADGSTWIAGATEAPVVDFKRGELPATGGAPLGVGVAVLVAVALALRPRSASVSRSRRTTSR